MGRCCSTGNAILDSTQALAVFGAAEVDPQVLGTPLPDTVAADVVAHLKDQADQHWYSSPKWSLTLAERIIAIGDARGDLGQQALGHMAQGDALKFMERHEDAWQALAHAAALYQSTGDEVGWARTRIGRLHSSVPLKRVPEALQDVARAEAIFTQADETERLLRLKLQVSLVYIYLANLDRAAEYLAATQALAAQLGPAGERYTGVVHINWGNIHMGRGAYAAATSAFEAALAHAVAWDHSLNAGIAETNLGWLHMARGRYRQALLALDNALRHTAHHPSYHPNLQRYRAECLLHLNRQAEALTLAREAEQALRLHQDEHRRAHCLILIGVAHMGLGEGDAGAAALAEAKAIFHELGATANVALAGELQSQVALKLGRSQEAYQLAQEAAQGLAACGLQASISQVVAAQAALHLGRQREAMETAQTVLRIAQRDDMHDQRYRAHLVLGQAAAAEHRLLRARRHYQAASAVIDRVQRELTVTLRANYLDDKEESLHALMGLHLRLGETEAAWRTLENAKAHTWLGYWNHQDQLRWAEDDPRNAELLQALRAEREAHHILYGLLAGHGAVSPGEAAAPPKQVRDQLAACERRLRALVESLHQRADQGRRFDPAAQAGAAELQNTLPEDATLLEYYSDGARLWCFVATRGQLRLTALPTAANEVARWIHHLQFNLETALTLARGAREHAQVSGQTVRLLQRLWQALLGPLGALPPGPLVIVPYGALHYLPFHLLHDGAQFLFERAPLSTTPAASLRTLPAPRRPAGALIVAHSWGGRLPLAQQEAEHVRRLLGGVIAAEAQATQNALRRPPVQVLHLAAHGHYRPDQPELSYLELADGQLFADDLFQHDLSYELVTLSACETGRAAAMARDDLIGLGRGVLFAGAGALVQSLWRVPDEHALTTMHTFYQHLARGAAKADALRQALLAGLAASGPAGLADWGAFQLVGHTGPLSSATPSQGDHT